MARKTKEEAQETRSMILRAAADVFWERGVAGAGLESIAEKAGVTRGAIYWHFKNKADIFDALHDELHSSIIDIILRDMETNHPQPLEQLEALCIALLRNLENDTHKQKVLSIFHMRCDYSGDMACFLTKQNEKKAHNATLFQRYFEKAIEMGHLPANGDARILTVALFCYTTGIVYEYLRNPNALQLSSQAPMLMRIFFNGLRTPCANR